MAILAGIDGKVVIDGSTMKVTSWSMTMAQELPDVTEIGDEFREYFPTLKSASGSMTFNCKSAEDKQNALMGKFTTGKSTAIAVELHYSTSSDKMSFSAFLSGADSPGSVEGVFPITCNFNMTGALNSVPTSTST